MTDKSTLVEFPADFIIKVFGPNHQQFIEDIRQLVHTNCEQSDWPKLTHKLSKNNQYISISVAVHVTSKAGLDNIYHALTSHPQVKMVI